MFSFFFVNKKYSVSKDFFCFVAQMERAFSPPQIKKKGSDKDCFLNLNFEKLSNGSGLL